VQAKVAGTFSTIILNKDYVTTSRSNCEILFELQLLQN